MPKSAWGRRYNGDRANMSGTQLWAAFRHLHQTFEARKASMDGQLAAAVSAELGEAKGYLCSRSWTRAYEPLVLAAHGILRGTVDYTPVV